jgi:hypothetical protein
VTRSANVCSTLAPTKPYAMPRSVAGADHFDARVRRRPRAPRHVADRTRVTRDLHEAGLGIDPRERRGVLVAPDADHAGRIAMPVALRVARRLHRHAEMIGIRVIRIERAGAHAARVETVGVACDVDVAEHRRRLRARGQRQREGRREREQSRHLVPQDLRRPRTSEKYPPTQAGCRIRL